MLKQSIVFLMSAALVVTSGCATHKFVRNTVNTSADALNAKIETNEGEIKEVRDDVDKKVSGVDSRVSALDSRTKEGMNALSGDIKNADQHAQQAQSSADHAANGVNSLDEKFKNRNHFDVSGETTIQFKFNSATLDKQYMDTLDGIASTLTENPDAIVVLEGRTDSVGAKDYNLKLGERRVEAVKHYLVVEKGVPVYKIHDISFGSEKPVAENKTREGREKNRAVVMTVMVPKGQGSVAARND